MTEYFCPCWTAEPTEATRALLASMRTAGCTVELADGALRVSAPKGVLTEMRRERIARHAGAIVALLGGEA